MKMLAITLAVMCSGIAQAAEFQKVLFLGNSITLHGPSKKVDWTGNWGMAASALDKDYVHLVTKALVKKDGTAPETLVNNIATFERQYAAYDAAPLKEAAAFGADLIVVCIGENVPNLTTDEAKAQFKESVVKMLNGVRADRKPVIIVRSSFWANAAKDKALKQACAEVGGTFVDISALCKDEKNFARSERAFKHAGVANHPGDKGMQAIADAIVGAVKGL
jgi:lysophospholipase L1-like esterase